NGPVHSTCNRSSPSANSLASTRLTVSSSCSIFCSPIAVAADGTPWAITSIVPGVAPAPGAAALSSISGSASVDSSPGCSGSSSSGAAMASSFSSPASGSAPETSISIPSAVMSGAGCSSENSGSSVDPGASAGIGDSSDVAVVIASPSDRSVRAPSSRAIMASLTGRAGRTAGPFPPRPRPASPARPARPSLPSSLRSGAPSRRGCGQRPHRRKGVRPHGQGGGALPAGHSNPSRGRRRPAPGSYRERNGQAWEYQACLGRTLVLREGDREDSLWNGVYQRSEEHTSALQSRENLVCRLLLEKKKQKPRNC